MNLAVKGENGEYLGRKDNFFSWRLKQKKWSSERIFCLENRNFFRPESRISATGFTTPRLRTRLTPLTE